MNGSSTNWRKNMAQLWVRKGIVKEEESNWNREDILGQYWPDTLNKAERNSLRLLISFISTFKKYCQNLSGLEYQMLV